MQNSSNMTNSYEDDSMYMNDSDVEDGDSEAYTIMRVKNKKVRYLSRNLRKQKPKDIPENKEFIESMRSFMLNSTIGNATRDNSTIDKAFRHLFFHEDSLLNFQTKKSPNFRLVNWKNFGSESFENLVNPRDWILDTCGNQGGKGIERLKSHSELRAYIDYELDQFDTSNEFVLEKNAIRENLNAISKYVTKGKFYNRYNKLANNFKQECDLAKKILNPSINHNVANCVKVWNESLEKEELDKDNQFIYEQAIKKGDISTSNFNKYAQYARMVLCLSDKSRQGAYKFKIQHYLDKLPQYYPPEYTGFEDLPNDWNPNVPPTEESEPDVWMIHVPGKFPYELSYVSFCPLFSYRNNWHFLIFKISNLVPNLSYYYFMYFSDSNLAKT